MWENACFRHANVQNLTLTQDGCGCGMLVAWRWLRPPQGGALVWRWLEALPSPEICFSVFSPDSPATSPQGAAVAQAATGGRSLTSPELPPTTDGPAAQLEQRLKEEERLLLAKLHHMTGGWSPVSESRSMRRLVPDPGDTDPDVPGLPDQSSVTAPINSFQEISLTESEDTGQPGQTQDE